MAKKDDAGDEDLEGLQLSINEKSDETLECTRRMREMCAEAKDSGDVPSLCAPRPQHKHSTVQYRTIQYMDRPNTTWTACLTVSRDERYLSCLILCPVLALKEKHVICFPQSYSIFPK